MSQYAPEKQEKKMSTTSRGFVDGQRIPTPQPLHPAPVLSLDRADADRPAPLQPETLVMASGRVVSLASPTSDMIDLGDIAHGLSILPRFNGQVYRISNPVNVAQHSIIVARMVAAAWSLRYGQRCPPHIELAALLHDAAEAYIGDRSTPVKEACPQLRELESRVWRAIAEHFGISATIPIEIDECDRAALLIEAAHCRTPDDQGVGLLADGLAACDWREEFIAYADDLMMALASGGEGHA